MQQKIKKVVLYARVSSKEQEKEGFSIPAQLELLRSYANRNNMIITKEFEDVETAKCIGRTNFNEMLKYLKNSKDCNTILVEKTDRLYRNLPDYVTVDNLPLDIHFVKEGVVLTPQSHLKTYNLDVLNNPWSITYDLALFPLLYYLKFSYGLDKWNWALFDFQVKKDDFNTLKVTLKINLLCIFFEFELGKNSVIRECNTYFYDDFRTLQVFGAPIAKQGKYGYDNIINIQIVRKNLAFLYALLEWHFDFQNSDYGFNTDEILVVASNKEYYDKEIFELVIKHINYIKNWEDEIEPYNTHKSISTKYNQKSFEKLKTLAEDLKFNQLLKDKNIKYPKMRLIDAYFWYIGGGKDAYLKRAKK